MGQEFCLQLSTDTNRFPVLPRCLQFVLLSQENLGKSSDFDGPGYVNGTSTLLGCTQYHYHDVAVIHLTVTVEFDVDTFVDRAVKLDAVLAEGTTIHDGELES